MIAVGDTRQGRARLTLRTGAQIKDLVRLEPRSLAFADRIGNAGQQADMACGRGDAMHRPADQADLAAAFHRGAHDRVDAGDVGGEAGDGDALFQRLDQLDQFVAHHGFGPGAAFDEDIGRVAHHGQHAGITQGLDALDVHRLTGDRVFVDLPVTSVENGAELGLDRQAVRLGDRMGQGDVVDMEGTDADIAAERHFDQFEIVDAGFAQLFAHQEGGKRRGVDRRLDLFPQPADRADVVFVGVGQNDRQDGLALEEFRIGNDDLDTRGCQVTKCDANIGDDPLAIMRRAEPVQVQIHADFVRSAERKKHQFVVIFHFIFGQGCACKFREGL